MVRGGHEHRLRGAGAQQPYPQQRSGRDVEGLGEGLVEVPLPVCGGAVVAAQVGLLEVHGRFGVDDLDRGAVVDAEGGAQCLVPAHDLGDGRPQDAGVQVALGADGAGHDVAGVVRP